MPSFRFRSEIIESCFECVTKQYIWAKAKSYFITTRYEKLAKHEL